MAIAAGGLAEAWAWDWELSCSFSSLLICWDYSAEAVAGTFLVCGRWLNCHSEGKCARLKELTMMTVPHASTEPLGIPTSSVKRPAKRRIILVTAVLMLAAFLAGFLPNYIRGQRLASELREARQESAMAELRDLAGLLYLQANQKDYGLAATTSTRFFERTRELANQIPDPGRKQPLEGLLSLRDQVTSGLAKGEPGVLNDLQELFVKTRQATSAGAGALRPE